MFARLFKILSIVWFAGWLLIWTLDIIGEYQHRDGYSIATPTGESRLDRGRFAREMIVHGIILFFVWPDALYLELRMRWFCKSTVIGRC